MQFNDHLSVQLTTTLQCLLLMICIKHSYNVLFGFCQFSNLSRRKIQKNMKHPTPRQKAQWKLVQVQSTLCRRLPPWDKKRINELWTWIEQVVEGRDCKLNYSRARLRLLRKLLVRTYLHSILRLQVHLWKCRTCIFIFSMDVGWRKIYTWYLHKIFGISGRNICFCCCFSCPQDKKTFVEFVSLCESFNPL